VLGLPPKGTHAHSMVQLFMALGGSEPDAFQAYADLYPDDCLLLVDTVDTLNSGVPNAIRVFEALRRKGHRPVGVRLDSGDLAYLSIQTAKQLDAAGFEGTSIVLSNQLDELVIMQIIAQIQVEAPRNGLDPEAVIKRLVFGVGTRLITSGGDAALDGVYKLVAVQGAEETAPSGGNPWRSARGNAWRPAIKLSETPAKVPNPGDKDVWRVYDAYGKAVVDLLSLSDERPADQDPLILRHPTDHTAHRALEQASISRIEPLLVDILREGRRVEDPPTLEAIRARREADIERLYPGVCRLVNPHHYHVSLTQRLWDLKQELIAAAH
jgi:nicotinate phosphoribosyltransferase